MGNSDFFEPIRTANFSEECFNSHSPFHQLFARMHWRAIYEMASNLLLTFLPRQSAAAKEKSGGQPSKVFPVVRIFSSLAFFPYHSASDQELNTQNAAMARFVLHVGWIQKQAHAEEVLGHAREQREVGGTLRTSSQGTRPQETSHADLRDQLHARSQGAATDRRGPSHSTCRQRRLAARGRSG